MQLIAWKDRRQNDLLCVKRDVKHPISRSLMLFSKSNEKEFWCDNNN